MLMFNLPGQKKKKTKPKNKKKKQTLKTVNAVYNAQNHIMNVNVLFLLKADFFYGKYF